MKEINYVLDKKKSNFFYTHLFSECSTGGGGGVNSLIYEKIDKF
jgi:hypothetical protein